MDRTGEEEDVKSSRWWWGGGLDKLKWGVAFAYKLFVLALSGLRAP